MDQLIKDIQYGIRGLLKHPGFTAVAVITLALGIGSNTAIFSVVNAVLLRPLSFRSPEQLMMVWEEASFAGFPRNTPAPANYADWKAQNHTFQEMAAIADRSFNLTGDGDPEHVTAYGVTADFFPMLGVQPFLGRAFLTEEDKPEANKVVILSHRLWQTRYGGQREILGRDILLNGQKHTVVGVMPAGFQFLDSLVRLWVPMAFEQADLNQRGAHYLTVVGRIKPGVSAAQAQADIETLMSRIAKDHPNETFDGKLGAVVVPLREQLAGDSRRPLLVLLIAVGFVLLIACANIASLMLSRAASRRREIAVRTALGANRFHIVRQLLTESVLLAALGGLIGTVLASWSFAFLQKLVPSGMTLSTSLKPDAGMLLFALSISMFTAIVFGLAPALQAAQFDLNEALKQGGSRGAIGEGNKLRRMMVVFQVALSLMLLIGAGLLIQTLFQLHNQYSVLEPEKVLTVRTQLPLDNYKQPVKRAAFYEQVLARVRSIPGVASAGYSTSVPLSWKGGTSGFYPEGTRQPLPGMSYDANHRQVSADYLKAMKIPLQQGRYFDEHDNAQSVPVAIINETMSRQYWPGESALGRRFKLGDPDEDVPWFTIVGVVADIRQMGLDLPVKAEMYLPYQQINTQPWFAPRDLAIRTTGNPNSIVGAVREAVRAIDPNQPVSSVATMEELLGEETAQRRIGMILLVTFAALALLLASLGIYGVLAYFVVQHTNEIGVRLALGATQGNILALVLKRGMRLTVLGVVVGLVGAFALTRLMTSLLFGVGAADPLTFISLPLLLAGVALLACWIPARRATKVDPLVALRYD
jgi:putative ABC transport system permease protein